MAPTVFDYTVRSIECANCGAPVKGSVEGGQVQCAYCNTPIVLGARPRAERREATEIDERARLAGLYAQVRSFDEQTRLIRPPQGLEAFVAMLANPWRSA
jgi:DNA-directed RNA polymerase subunit RPC12/RpoP